MLVWKSPHACCQKCSETRNRFWDLGILSSAAFLSPRVGFKKAVEVSSERNETRDCEDGSPQAWELGRIWAVGVKARASA